MYWIGSITGMIGALLLAMNNEFSKYGYIFFAISAFCLIFAFYRDRMMSMLSQQIVFLSINIYGGFQWLI